jgi:hypothetical protein
MTRGVNMKQRARLAIALLLWIAGVVAAYDTRYGQVSVGTGSASQIGNATGRRTICWQNTSTTNRINCDKVSTVTGSTGMPMAAGDRFCSNDPSAAIAVYCIATGGTVTVGFKENYE